MEANKANIEEVDQSLKHRVGEVEDISLNIRVDLDNTKATFVNDLKSQNQELKNIINYTEINLDSRHNDNLDNQNMAVQKKLGELSNQIEIANDKTKREKLEVDEHFRNIGQSISTLKNESEKSVTKKIIQNLRKR